MTYRLTWQNVLMKVLTITFLKNILKSSILLADLFPSNSDPIKKLDNVPTLILRDKNRTQETAFDNMLEKIR